MPSPIRIVGEWDEGFALDLYSSSSVYLGEDAFGHPLFRTEHTAVGRLLYQFKYNGHLDTRKEIAAAAADFAQEWLSDKSVDIIIPCPASVSRAVQPVYAIAYELALLLDLPYSDEVFSKTTQDTVKNTPKDQRDLSGSIIQNKPAKRQCNILLIDDIYETGATANECVRVLKQDPLVRNVYFLAIAKKRK